MLGEKREPRENCNHLSLQPVQRVLLRTIRNLVNGRAKGRIAARALTGPKLLTQIAAPHVDRPQPSCRPQQNAAIHPRDSGAALGSNSAVAMTRLKFP